jgi:heat shock protein HtpX
MPLTFIDIERTKNRSIWILFLFLLFMYFLIAVTSAAAFLHVALFAGLGFWIKAAVFSLIVSGIHFWFSAYDMAGQLIQSLNAAPPDPRDAVHSVLLNVMEEVRIATGKRRNIQCVVIPTLSMNALAVADLKGTAVIGITEGLLSRLDRRQIEAVIAHETHHILSGDCLEATVAASLFGTYASIFEKLSDDNSSSRNRSFVSPPFVLAALLLKLSWLLNMFISREREYRADAAAVRMTRDPIALAETLYLLSRSWRGSGFIGSGLEMICIVNPEAAVSDESEGFWADLVSTHPPIRKRIDVLLGMAHTNIAALETSAERRATQTSQKPAEQAAPVYYAMNPQHAWQGPFDLAQLTALPWLSPLTWITNGPQQPAAQAGKDATLSTLFAARSGAGDKPGRGTCPTCRTPLGEETYEGATISACRFCCGMLVETGQIARILARTKNDQICSERLLQLARATLQQNQMHSTRRMLNAEKRSTTPLLSCPKCGNPMSRGFYSMAQLIEVDRCSMCDKIWFDKDELAMLQCVVANKIVATVDVGNALAGMNAQQPKSRI